VQYKNSELKGKIPKLYVWSVDRTTRSSSDSPLLIVVVVIVISKLFFLTLVTLVIVISKFLIGAHINRKSTQFNYFTQKKEDRKSTFYTLMETCAQK